MAAAAVPAAPATGSAWNWWLLPVGLLVAGQKETVEFRHRFTKAGPQVIAADSTE
jgi:cytochrome c-type biogenesis protein CcmH/NrfF